MQKATAYNMFPKIAGLMFNGKHITTDVNKCQKLMYDFWSCTFTKCPLGGAMLLCRHTIIMRSAAFPSLAKKKIK